MWTFVANTQQELMNRGVTDFPKWAPKATLAKMLEDIIIEEEKRERKALLLSKQWKAFRAEMRVKAQVLEHARLRAEEEFTYAMDAAGQVYIFGKGRAGQFQAPPRRDGFRGWSRVRAAAAACWCALRCAAAQGWCVCGCTCSSWTCGTRACTQSCTCARPSLWIKQWRARRSQAAGQHPVALGLGKPQRGQRHSWAQKPLDR